MGEVKAIVVGRRADRDQGSGNAARPSFLRRVSTAVDRGISRFFYHEAAFVARHPYLTIVLSVLLALACGSGLYFKFDLELDDVDLYTPKSAQSLKDIDYVLDVYGNPPLEDRILAVSKKGRWRTNLLANKSVAKKNLMEFMELWNQMEALTTTYEGDNVTYDSVCFEPVKGLPCWKESVLDAWSYDMEKLKQDDDVIATLSKDIKDAYGRIIEKEVVLGGVKTNGKGRIVKAEAFQMIINLQNNMEEIDGATYDPRSDAYDELVNHLLKRWKGPRLSPYITNKHSVDKESDELIKKDIFKLASGYFLIVVYSFIVLFRNSPAFNKAPLTLVSVISIVFAIASAFGAGLWAGFKYNLVTATIPFIMFGLGTDDTFVIMGAYQQIDIDLPIVERVALALGRAGSSIFVTSLTDCIAFIAGTYTEIQGIQTFCVFSAFGIFFDFFYQVTFFLAFVALDSRREVRARNGAGCWGYQFGCGPTEHDIENIVNIADVLDIGRKTADKGKMKSGLSFSSDEVDSPIRAAICSEGSQTSMSSQSAVSEISEISEAPIPKPKRKGKSAGTKDKTTMQITISEATARQIPGIPKSMSTGVPIWGNKIFGKGPYDPHKLPLRQKIVGTWLPAITLHPAGQVLIMLVEALAVAATVYGCTKLQMNLNYREWFTPKGSWLHEGYKVEDTLFGGAQNVFDMITKKVDDDYFYHQDDLLRLSNATRENPFVAPYPPVESWYEEFREWLPESRHKDELVKGEVPDPESFNSWVKEFLFSPEGKKFFGFIIFDENDTRIISSRIEAYTRDVSAAQKAVDMVKNVRATAKEAGSELGTIAFGYNFVFYDGFAVIVPETLRNILSAAGAVFAVTVITLANITAALSVLLMVALTDVMLLGVMYWTGLTFNIVTSVNIILSVGIAVDYAAHVAHAFLSTKGTPKERAKGALDHIGGEVLAGAVTTWLAIVIMYFGEHYIFKVFFIMFLTTVTAAVWHGLVILPILLTWIRPRAYDDELTSSHHAT